MNCIACGYPMDPILAPATTHPNCEVPAIQFTELDDGHDPAAAQLKSELIEIIRWYDNRSPRGTQRELGPSDISAVCDRRIGYQIAGIPAVNTDYDKWPANVGTAIHSYLESAVKSWQRANGSLAWITEKTVSLGNDVIGHADLYNQDQAMVIDHKTASTDIMQKIRKEGPPPNYVTQVQLYGLGYEKAGFPVKRVALAFYPRSGWLKDMYVWVADYDRSIGEQALARPYAIAKTLMNLQVTMNPHRWEQVDATSSNDCGFCPMYQPNIPAEFGASDKGCPGK